MFSSLVCPILVAFQVFDYATCYDQKSLFRKLWRICITMYTDSFALNLDIYLVQEEYGGGSF